MASSSEPLPETSGEITIIDVSTIMRRHESAEAEEAATRECERCAEALRQYGVLCVRDPRVTEEDNNRCVAIYQQGEDSYEMGFGRRLAFSHFFARGIGAP